MRLNTMVHVRWGGVETVEALEPPLIIFKGFVQEKHFLNWALTCTEIGGFRAIPVEPQKDTG